MYQLLKIQLHELSDGTLVTGKSSSLKKLFLRNNGKSTLQGWFFKNKKPREIEKMIISFEDHQRFVRHERLEHFKSKRIHKKQLYFKYDDIKTTLEQAIDKFQEDSCEEDNLVYVFVKYFGEKDKLPKWYPLCKFHNENKIKAQEMVDWLTEQGLRSKYSCEQTILSK